MKPITKRIAIAAGAAAAAGIGTLLWQRMNAGTYVQIPTMFGPARIYQVEDDAGRPVRLLEVGGVVHSGTYMDDDLCYDLVFEYLKRYDAMFDLEAAGLTDWPAHPVRRVLVLGCGGYDYPEHLLAHHPEVSVDAIEIDPAITDIAQRYFWLDRCIEEFDAEESGRLHMFCADARIFLEEAAARNITWDAIVNDTFDAADPVMSLATHEAARYLHACLEPGGFYLVNVVSALEGSQSAFLHQQAAILRDVFADVAVLTCDPESLTDPDNVILIAHS